MNKDQISLRPGVTDPESFNLSNVVRAISAHKKRIIAITVGAALLSAGISLLIPPTFTATTTLLPPQQAQSNAAALLSQLGGAAGVVASATGIKNPSDMYLGILKSRTISDEVVQRLKLQAVYETNSPERARKALQASTFISAGKDGMITISVDDHDKVRAAQIANTYVDALEKLTRALALTEASKRRLFFEKQLEAAKNNLASAELALKRGLDARGVISVDADSRTVLETIAKLRARISAKEVELNAMKSFVTENNNEFKRTQAELQSMRSELSTLENGRASTGLDTEDSGNRPGLESIRLLREVKYNQMLYELLAKQFEAARLEEARDSAVIQVLDPAIPPEQKSKPRRSLIVLAATSFAFLLSLAYCLWVESRKRITGGELLGEIRHDAPAMKSGTV